MFSKFHRNKQKYFHAESLYLDNRRISLKETAAKLLSSIDLKKETVRKTF